MQNVKKMYRTDYTGEEIIRDLVWQNSTWDQTSEFVPNNVINNQISNRAVIIGNGTSRTQLNSSLFSLLKNHKGGLLAAGKLQTYGCNALYRDFEPDFLVAGGKDIVKEIADSGYCDNHIVYSAQDAVLDYPGKFYLTPQNPHWNTGAVAAYLAAFDGHKQVYLMGFDCHSGDDVAHDNVYLNTFGYGTGSEPSTELYFVKSLQLVMDIYSDVEFIRVMPTTSWYMPDHWKYQVNLRQISFNDFVLEIDL